MKVRVWGQEEVRAGAHAQLVLLFGRNTTRPILLPRTQPSRSTPPTASMLSRPSTSPAFAEALLQYLWAVRRSAQTVQLSNTSNSHEKAGECQVCFSSFVLPSCEFLPLS